MKTKIIILVVLFSLNAHFTLAESNNVEILDSYINNIVDCSNKETWELESTDFDSDYCIVQFDLRDGWKSIAIKDGEGHYRLHFHFSDEEILSACFHTITLFSKIENSLSDSKKLKCELLLYDTESVDAQKCIITAETVHDYYSWIT